MEIEAVIVFVFGVFMSTVFYGRDNTDAAKWCWIIAVILSLFLTLICGTTIIIN